VLPCACAGPSHRPSRPDPNPRSVSSRSLHLGLKRWAEEAGVLSTKAPTDPLFRVQHDLHDGFARLFVRGELDLVTAPVLEAALASLERRSDPIVVDLGDLSFMDASGLRALAGAWRRASEKGRPLTFTQCPPMVRRLLEMTGMADMLGEALPESWGCTPVADWRELEVGNETRARDIKEIEDANFDHPGGSAPTATSASAVMPRAWQRSASPRTSTSRSVATPLASSSRSILRTQSWTCWSPSTRGSRSRGRSRFSDAPGESNRTRGVGTDGEAPMTAVIAFACTTRAPAVHSTRRAGREEGLPFDSN
jgi:anti-sigma B factor antagonist